MSEQNPEFVPTDDDLELEAPNEGATGENPEVEDVDLESLEDDDGYPEEDDDY